MPYKVYTYEDPYKLNQTDFWSEISGLPHFCVARTLVNGLKDIIKDDIHGLICPLDNLVRHEEMYKSWTDNISLRIQQYSALTALFNKKSHSGEIDTLFRQSLSQNQTQFLDAIRLFIELDIEPSVIDKSKGNKEQRLFVDVLEEVKSNSLFTFPKSPTKDQLKNILNLLALNELKEYEEKSNGHTQDKGWYERAIINTKQWDGNAIVIHGVHQFSPAQLRLVMDLDKLGVTVIFLFNYQSKYSEIYSSWDCIYKCFEVPMHHDKNIESYQMSMLQTPSNALACAIGAACDSSIRLGSKQFQKWYQLYKNVEFLEFANITEYAHFVSNHFDYAIQKYHDELGIMERGNNQWNNVAVLRHMTEQVYTANRDVHTLLKIYYPEYAKNRYFLAYPIGQFFSSIYKLWDYENAEIKIESSALKECLSSNILKAGKGEELLRTFSNIEMLFDGVDSYTEFRQKIATDYVAKYDQVQRSRGSDVVFSLRSLSIYNPYVTTRKDIEGIINAVDELNEIATFLFSFDKTREDYINFGKHFQNLEEFLKRRELSLANEEEKNLILALQSRLNQIKPEHTAFSGTFKDLQEGLYYYLKQKDDEERVDWIVKNFEQIDGDILQSKHQSERGEKKVYHFACISDRDLNCKMDDLLPWPLTDAFIRKAYSPADLQFQVYYSALGERGNFLRYALFYGLCFNYEGTRLSYVKQYGDEITEPYALLRILGLGTKSGLVKSLIDTDDYSISVKRSTITNIKATQNELMDMFLCPYRFFMDYVLEDSPVIKDDFLYQKLYENLIIEMVWKKIEKKPGTFALQRLKAEISSASASIKSFFSFWKNTEIDDLERRAENFITYNLIKDRKVVPDFDQIHMNVRKQYGKAKYDVDISDREPHNPYQSFESLTERKYPTKGYSYYKVNPKNGKGNTSDMQADIVAYLNDTSDSERIAIPSQEWCNFCHHRGVCLKPFLSES